MFHRSKTNKNGSILWRCQQYFPKAGQDKCCVSCSTIDGIFLRNPPTVHQHDSLTRGQKVAMELVDQVATEVPKSKSNLPLQRIWEKVLSKHLREIYSLNDSNPKANKWNLKTSLYIVHNLTTDEPSFRKFAEKISQFIYLVICNFFS